MVDVAALSGRAGLLRPHPGRDFAPFSASIAAPARLERPQHQIHRRHRQASRCGTSGRIFTIHASLGSSGFDIAQFVRTRWDEERKVVFSDGTDTIFIADMSGDRLNDIARVRSGETAYWRTWAMGVSARDDGSRRALRFGRRSTPSAFASPMSTDQDRPTCSM
jgi:hypothetical protein